MESLFRRVGVTMVTFAVVILLVHTSSAEGTPSPTTRKLKFASDFNWPWPEHKPPYGDKPPPYGDKPPPYGDKPPPYGDKPPPYGDKPPPYGDKPPPYGDKPPPYGEKPPPYGDKPPPYGDKPPPYGDKPPPYGDKPPPYGDKSPPYGDKPPPYGDKPPERGGEREDLVTGTRWWLRWKGQLEESMQQHLYWPLEIETIRSPILGGILKQNKTLEAIRERIIPDDPMFYLEYLPQIETLSLPVEIALDSLPPLASSFIEKLSSEYPFIYWTIRDYAAAYSSHSMSLRQMQVVCILKIIGLAVYFGDRAEKSSPRKGYTKGYIWISFKPDDIRRQAEASTKRHAEGWSF
ncbi:hypothetical protein R1sor_024039 [Riccia sorocarpa]|uniref:Uncharacterized protein n=1 Tax=Riccia sorocarpa TaxID=122646 RepID=A0ABD3GQ35_9MARC